MNKTETNPYTWNKLMVARWEGAGGWIKGEGMKECKSAVIKQSRGCRVQHRECSHYYRDTYMWSQVGASLTGVSTLSDIIHT